MIGQAVSRCRILEKVGDGGMGVVYTAEDMKFNRFLIIDRAFIGGAPLNEEDL
jgi:hypothetical protein